MTDPNIRVSEVFTSVQGEGPKTGIPTTFLRLAGCNFRCPGWSVETTLPDGEKVTGCDSPHSVFPQLYLQDGNSTLYSSESLLELIPEYPKNVCLTGGEPLLQWKRVELLITSLLLRGQEVEIFTNGSLRVPWRPGLVGELAYSKEHSVSLVVDCKPPSSGEFGKFNYENFFLLNSNDSIKFVIGDRYDYEVSREIVQIHGKKFRGQWWMGVVFQKLDPRELIGWILEDRLNVRLNLQTQSLMGMDESERTAYAKLV